VYLLKGLLGSCGGDGIAAVRTVEATGVTWSRSWWRTGCLGTTLNGVGWLVLGESAQR